MTVKKETEIVKNWPTNSPPMVSINCFSYNQEKYISNAIEGFLIQETNFPFEIIIHDDASTDKTPEIIREYEKQYSKIIKPIYQTENQYSKRKYSIWADLTFPLALGKYIALCEGDDYWTDPNKLQKQVELLEANPKCSLCFHNSLIIFADKSKADSYFCIDLKDNQVFKTKDLILANWFVPTASILLKRSNLVNYPDWWKAVFNGDLLLQLLVSLNGNLIYIDEVMAVYRKNVQGSLSSIERNPTFFLRARISASESYMFKPSIRIFPSILTSS